MAKLLSGEHDRIVVDPTLPPLRVAVVSGTNDEGRIATHVMIPIGQWEDLQSQLNMIKADIERLKNEVIR